MIPHGCAKSRWQVLHMKNRNYRLNPSWSVVAEIVEKTWIWKEPGPRRGNKRCIGQVWHRSALLEVMEKGPQVDGLFRQLARREIITKNVAPSRKNFQRHLSFKGAGATPPRTHCIRPIWRRRARLKAMDEGRDIDGFSPWLRWWWCWWW